VNFVCYEIRHSDRQIQARFFKIKQLGCAKTVGRSDFHCWRTGYVAFAFASSAAMGSTVALAATAVHSPNLELSAKATRLLGRLSCAAVGIRGRLAPFR